MPGYGTPLGLTLPTIGGLESAAAPLINTALAALITRLESKVGAADLDVNADVSFKSGAVYSGATNLQRAAFQNRTAGLTAATNPATVYVLNGDLHYIDGAGNLVQITAGGQVNVSTTGGITGAGYGTSGVEVNWDSVNSRYRLRSGSATDEYADAVLADVLLNDGSGNFLRLQAPALAGDYTLTLPSAAPASTSMLQVTSGGLMQTTTAPTLTGVTVNGPASVTSGGLTVTGGITMSGTSDLVVGGDIDGSGDISAGIGDDFICTAPGRYCWDADTGYYHASMLEGGNPAALGIAGYRTVAAASGVITCALPRVGTGMTINSASVLADKTGGAGDRTLEICHTNISTGALIVDETLTSTTTGMGSVSYNFDNTDLVGSGYFLRFIAPDGDRIYEITVNYSRLP